MNNVDPYKTEVTDPTIPLICCLIIGWGVGNVFMDVYGLAVDSILHCFVLDEQLAKKKGGDAQNTPETLRAFLKKTDK